MIIPSTTLTPLWFWWKMWKSHLRRNSNLLDVSSMPSLQFSSKYRVDGGFMNALLFDEYQLPKWFGNLNAHKLTKLALSQAYCIHTLPKYCVLSQEHRLIKWFISSGKSHFHRANCTTHPCMLPINSFSDTETNNFNAHTPPHPPPTQATQLCHFLKRNIIHFFCQC